MKIYSAIINNYDKPIKQKGVKTFEEISPEPKERSRWYKTHPHILFPKEDITLWKDGNIKIIGKISELPRWADIMVFKHSRRNCIYEKAAEIISRGLDDKEKVYEQIFQYTKEGYPANNGLCECPVILRRNTKEISDFNEAWWKEINEFSRRDQISFTYLANKMGLSVATFEGSIQDNEIFKKHLHNS